MQRINHPQTTTHPAQLLILLRGERNGNQRPRYDPWSAIMEEFEVPEFAETRVQLDADEVVENQRAAELAIQGVRGGDVGFEDAEARKEDPVDCGSDEEAFPIICYDG